MNIRVRNSFVNEDSTEMARFAIYGGDCCLNVRRARLGQSEQ